MGRIFSANNLLTTLLSASSIASLGLLVPFILVIVTGDLSEHLGQNKTNSNGSFRSPSIA